MFWTESVFLLIYFLYRLRIYISFSYSRRCGKTSDLIQDKLVWSISEWSHVWEIHEPLIVTCALTTSNDTTTWRVFVLRT